MRHEARGMKHEIPQPPLIKGVRGIFLLLASSFMISCAKPVVIAKINENPFFYEKIFSVKKEAVIEASKKALTSGGYSVANADPKAGKIESGWVSATVDSHYIDYFDRKDYGVNGAYHQLVIEVFDNNGASKVRVASRIKGLSSAIKSSGSEEKSFFTRLGNYLRNSEPSVTNLGVGK